MATDLRTDCDFPPEPVWHLSVAYDGTNYHGWQIQPAQRTVQGEIQKRICRLFDRSDLRTVGCSRTDAGVHALDQQVSFAGVPPGDIAAPDLKRILNRWLPDDILIRDVRLAAPGFSARFDNCGKAYTYVISPGRMHPLFSRFAWHVPQPLDLGAMQATASILVGEHSFESFAVNAKREIESYVRLLHRVEVTQDDGLICVNVVGESFLYKMVRSIVGWLVHVGSGRAHPDATLHVLEAKDRCAAADSAPAQGLFLAHVFFGADEWRVYEPLLPPFRWL